MLAQTDGRKIVNDALTAMGGVDRVMSVSSLVVEGGGHDFEIDQGFRWDELGLQSDLSQIRDYKRTYDLVNGRARFEQTHQREYAFYEGNGPVRQVQGLDGLIAFNVSPEGKVSRMFAPGQLANVRFEYLRHPLTLLRAALAPNSTIANVRASGGEQLIDLTLPGSPPINLTVAFDNANKLPTRVFRMADSPTMGDRPIETRFAEYASISGIQLPTRLISKIDRFVNADLRITKQTINSDVTDLAVPASVVSATPPANGGQGPGQQFPVTAQEVAKGIWMIAGTTHHSLLVEFSDHLMIIDAVNIERTQAVMAKAKELRPNKPVTQLLMTHHHSDHTGGNRTAVALGVNEIIAYKTNVPYLNEMFRRPHTINPDLFVRNNAKAPKITSIDDEGTIEDAAMTVKLYHLLDNSHADSQLLIYFPRQRVLTQADDYMPNDGRNITTSEPLGHAPWNANVLANINYRKLQVDVMAPIHGEVVPYSQFVENAIMVTQYLPPATGSK